MHLLHVSQSAGPEQISVPVVGGIVSARLPAAVQCAFRAELAFQTGRGLRYGQHATTKLFSTADYTHLDLDEVKCLCEELIGHGDDLAAQRDAR